MKIRRSILNPLAQRASKMLARVTSPLVHNPLPGFDAVYYRYWYRDVLAYSGGPIAHYLHHGWREGRDPSAGFSTSGYLKANPDVEHADLNPLLHFLECGLAEGRMGWQKDGSAPPPAPKNVQAPLKLLPPPQSE